MIQKKTKTLDNIFVLTKLVVRGYNWKCESVTYSVVSNYATSWNVAPQAPLPMGFSRQYWSGLPCASPGNLPNPGTEPGSPAWQANSLPSEPPGKAQRGVIQLLIILCFFFFFFFNLLYWFWHTLTKNKGLFWKTKTLCRRDCIVGLSWFFFFFFDPTRLLKEMYVLCQDFIHCHPLD